MDYSTLANGLTPKVMAAVEILNNPEVAPDIRQLNQEILFREVGRSIYAKVYDMNAFDMEIAHTIGPGIDDRYFGLAKVASASVSTGKLGLEEYVKNYLDTMAALAQRDAMINASQSGKRPTVTRTPKGSKTCEWCKARSGFYTDPPAEVFWRHGGCDCSIVTEGYRSRNGLLGNYVKPKDR